MNSDELAALLAKALDGKKGQNIKVLKTEELTTLADYFVLCTATSNTQVKAMSDACEEAAEKRGEHAHHIHHAVRRSSLPCRNKLAEYRHIIRIEHPVADTEQQPGSDDGEYRMPESQ